MEISAQRLDDFWVHLRNNFRLKANCDYSHTFKYGELRIFCYEVYRERIAQEAEKFGLDITEFCTYGARGV